MATFDHSLARFAGWNLAGNTPFNPNEGIEVSNARFVPGSQGSYT